MAVSVPHRRPIVSSRARKNCDFSPKIRPKRPPRTYTFGQPCTSTHRELLLLSETRIRCPSTQEREAMTTLRAARRSRMQYAWPLHEDARTVGHARAAIRHELSALTLSSDLIDDAVLMVSELITNALLYGDGPYELVLHIDTKEIMCVVVDSSPLLPAPSPPDVQAEHGRGLRIVARLSDGFYGCHPQRYITHPDLVGKATWFAIPRQGTPGNVVPLRAGT
ncbi:ATP-binding protein [Nonomuraea sp. M3C6]|uniref:ATP-binding protein n=1 Tax=Nonomuraea marmarensis TaxID=3351344 RepID=A0ABW7ALK4_9ACTN